MKEAKRPNFLSRLVSSSTDGSSESGRLSATLKTLRSEVDQRLSVAVVVVAIVAAALSIQQGTWWVVLPIMAITSVGFWICQRLLPGEFVTRSGAGVALALGLGFLIYNLPEMPHAGLLSLSMPVLLIGYRDWKCLAPGTLALMAFLALAGSSASSGLGEANVLTYALALVGQAILCALIALRWASITAKQVEQEDRLKKLESHVDEHFDRTHRSEAEVKRMESELEKYRRMMEQEVHEKNRVELSAHLQELVIRNSTNGIVISDASKPEMPLVYVNPAFEHITGYSAAESIGRNCRFLQVINEDQAKLETLRQAMHEGKSCTVIVRNYRKNGKLFWNEFNLFPVHDDAGILTHFIGTINDITDRVEAQNRRDELERKLEGSHKMENLGLLTGSLAHDFNNRLTSVLGNASLAKLKIDAPEMSSVRAYLTKIEDAAKQAANLCNQVLSFSRSSNTAVTAFNPSQVVQEMSNLLQLTVKKKAALNLQLEDGLPAVTADVSALRRVLLNLVINAAETFADSSGRLRVTTRQVDADRDYLSSFYEPRKLPDGKYVALEIKDDATDENAESKSRMGDPESLSYFGGRELSAVELIRFAREYHWALKIWQEPGRSFGFIVLIPGEGTPAPEVEMTDTELLAGWRGQGTVLLVDDEEIVRTVTRRMLESLGLNVILAGDATEAVERFEAQQDEIQAVILDNTMPRVGGEAVLSKIREIHPETPVLLMSGYPEEEAMDRFAGLDLEGFLQKPFQSEDLVERLQGILDPVAA